MTTTSCDTSSLTDDQKAAFKQALECKMRELAPNANQGTRDYRDIERSLADWLMYRLQVSEVRR